MSRFISDPVTPSAQQGAAQVAGNLNAAADRGVQLAAIEQQAAAARDRNVLEREQMAAGREEAAAGRAHETELATMRHQSFRDREAAQLGMQREGQAFQADQAALAHTREMEFLEEQMRLATDQDLASQARYIEMALANTEAQEQYDLETAEMEISAREAANKVQILAEVVRQQAENITLDEEKGRRAVQRQVDALNTIAVQLKDRVPSSISKAFIASTLGATPEERERLLYDTDEVDAEKFYKDNKLARPGLFELGAGERAVKTKKLKSAEKIASSLFREAAKEIGAAASRVTPASGDLSGKMAQLADKVMSLQRSLSGASKETIDAEIKSTREFVRKEIVAASGGALTEWHVEEMLANVLSSYQESAGNFRNKTVLEGTEKRAGLPVLSISGQFEYFASKEADAERLRVADAMDRTVEFQEALGHIFQKAVPPSEVAGMYEQYLFLKGDEATPEAAALLQAFNAETRSYLQRRRDGMNAGALKRKELERLRAEEQDAAGGAIRRKAKGLGAEPLRRQLETIESQRKDNRR